MSIKLYKTLAEFESKLRNFVSAKNIFLQPTQKSWEKVQSFKLFFFFLAHVLIYYKITINYYNL